MADIGDAAGRAFDARRRTVGIRRRRPGRPLCPGAAPVAIDQPAQQIPPAPRRRAVGVEKALAVEMIGDRTGVIARHFGSVLYQFAAAARAGITPRLTQGRPLHLFSARSRKRLKLITADRPVRPEATARQRDAPSGVFVFAGLDPAIHATVRPRWMPGSSPGMTEKAPYVRQSFRAFECGPRPPDPARRAVGGGRRRGAAGGAARADRGRRGARRRPRLHRRGEEARRRRRGHQVGHARPDGREDRARPVGRDLGLERAADRPQRAGRRSPS